MDQIMFSCSASGKPKHFPHFWEHTIGSGHAAFALRSDWREQMRRCASELGFKHVRFHHILTDEFSTVTEKDGEYIYDFYNADSIIDFLLKINMKPFVELSFMPQVLASGDKTVFSYAANVTPPADYGKWQQLIHHLISHWIERYGLEEVAQWYFEVWNEPNLKSFWSGSKSDYFNFYRDTATTIKNIHQSLRVGGPATAKNDWIKDFTDFCNTNNVPFDFITTHHYPTDAFGSEEQNTEEQLAKSKRSILREQAAQVREQSSGKPVYYTEWSSSSNAFDELHDQPYAACFIVKTVMEAQGLVDGYSYWAFSDIFSEQRFSSIPFHGGFGLLNVYNIPKPAYRAFELLHKLGTETLPVIGSHPTVDMWVTRNDSQIKMILTNWALPKHPIEEQTVRINLEGFKLMQQGFIQRVDDTHSNARKLWLEKNSPTTLKPQEAEEMDKASNLLKEDVEVQYGGDNAILTVHLPIQGLACVTLSLEKEKANPLPQLDAQDTEMINILQRESLEYFLHEVNPDTGLIADTTKRDAPCSIAAVGIGISCYVAAVDSNLMPRGDAVTNINKVLQFLLKGDQSPKPDATGYNGFFYHFLDMKTGKRALQSELSTIDNAMLVAGALTAQSYFDGTDKEETTLRELATNLYTRVNWQWALNGGDTLCHGWKPESGFLPNCWNKDYAEAHILYILALGSPSYPTPDTGYKQWTSTFEWKDIYGYQYYYAGPLFIHQLSQVWLDMQGIYDEANNKAGIDYFENSRRATYAQQQYAIRNPLGFKAYGEYAWGFTASDGPGPDIRMVDGIQREFLNYTARGIPFGPDDGTISPWVAATSIPFAPEIVLPTMRHSIEKFALKKYSRYGFDASFNPTYPEKGVNPNGWISPEEYAINQGPVVLMLANYKNRLIWNLMKKNSHVVKGLLRAGFTGGWLKDLRGF